MQGRITDVLVADHQRLGALLTRAYDGDRASYDQFRGGLLRHIGIEEKILLPELRATGYEPPIATQLHLDHAAVVAMLVPTPSTALLARIRTLLAEHDPLEEAAGGLYPLADELIGDVDAVLARIMHAPVPPMARHFDGARAFAAIELLAARAAGGRARPPE